MTAIRILAIRLPALGAAGCDRQQASPANPPGTAAMRSVDRAIGTTGSQ